MKNVDKLKNPCQNLYMFKDVKARRWFQLFPAENNDIAMRILAQSANSMGNFISENPWDFELYHVGDIDPCDGQIDILSDAYEFICAAGDVQQQPTETNEK